MKNFNSFFNQLTAMPKRLAMVLTMIFVVGVVQVFADYTIEFKSNTKNEDGSTAQTSIANLISSGGDNVSTISAAKAYNGKSGYGVKLGSSGDVGYVTMNLVSAAQIKASKLVVSAAYFDSGKTLKVTITYTDNTTTTKTLTPASTITAYDVELTATKNIKTIKIESVTKSKGRMYCASIKVVAAAASYTVTYEKNGATSGTVPTDATQYNSGASVTVKTNSGNLARTGYTFGGWNTNSTGTGTNYTAGSGTFKITGNTTLYAKWTANTYDITLSAPNSSISSQDIQATYNSSSITGTITNPTKTGYTFKGWYSGENGTGSLVINENKQLQANVSGYTGANGVWNATTGKTLHAGWTINSHTLTWKVNGGNALTGSYTSGTVEYGATITNPADPTRTGYSFLGWHDGTDIVTPATTMPDHDLTYTAQWQINTYTVTWIVDGVTKRTDTGVAYNTSKTAPTVSPIPCGDVIAGWTDAENGNYVHGTSTLHSGATPSITITSDKTFYAVFADYAN